MNHNPYTDPVECPECGRQYERTDWDGTTPCPSDDCPSHEVPLDPTDLSTNLRQFIGTESYHRYLMGVVLTDGALYFAKNAGGGAFWLMDILATQPEIRQQPFAHVTLTVEDDSTANLTVTDGNDNQVYERTINFTTCPAGKWEFYVTGGVIMLPGEY